MKKRIISFSLCLILLFSAVGAVPFEGGFFAPLTASAADFTSLQRLYNTVPKESEWNRVYISGDELNTLKTAYDSASKVLENSASTENEIQLAEILLETALKAMKYHTLDINLKKTSATVNVGESLELEAQLTPSNAADSIKWTSSDESVATVSSTGVVEVKKYSASRILISAISNGHSSSCSITVKNNLAGVSLSKSSETMYPGKTFTLSYETYGADKSAAITGSIDSVEWTSEFPAIATVDKNGLVTANREGTTTVSVEVKSGDIKVKSSCAVTVGKLVSVSSLEPQTVSDGEILPLAIVGREKKIEVKVLPASASIKELVWTSSDPSVVSVSSNGIVDSISSATVKFLKVGTATITYKTTDGSDISGSFKVEVKPMISGLSVSPEKVVIIPGSKSEKISVSVTPKDAGNQVIDWSSSDTSVCEVSTSGVLNAKKKGECIITAKTTDGSNISKEIYVRVENSALSVSVEPTTLSIKVGQTSALKATVTTSTSQYNDVSWLSGDVKVATVDQNGVVKGVYPGKTSIKATALDGSGRSSVCTVTVTAGVTGVELPQTAVVSVNKTAKLTATVLPEYATNKNVTWKSSNTDIVDVSSDGTLTGKTVGTATVSCVTADGGYSASCEVKVVIPVTSVTISPKTKTVEAGTNFRITESVAPTNATIKTVTWTSSNESVATVSSNGVVTAVAGGTARITCKTDNGGLTDYCDLTVTQKVSGVSVEPKTVSIYKTQTTTLTASVLPSTATNKAVTWSTNNKDVAVVSSSGVVTGVSNGTAVITVKTADGGYTAQCTVIVGNKISVTGIKLNEKEISLGKNETFTLDATISPSNASNKSVTWTSSAPGVAKVSSTGTVTAVSNGSAVITATTADGGYTAKCKVDVSQNVTGVKLDRVTAKIAVDQALPLVATVVPADAGNKGLKWESSNPKVATVNSAGIVTGLTAGTTTITVTTAEGGKTAYCSVTVYVPVTGIKVNSRKVTVAKGGKAVVTATVLPDNAEDREYTWSSKDESIATVNAAGQITGKKIGDTIITATSHEGGKKAYCLVEVVQLSSSVSLNFSSITMDAGVSKTLTATVKPSNTSDKSITWTSSDSKVAKVSSRGVVTGVSAGSAVIKATAADGSGASASCRITVTQKITKVTFSKKTFSARVGEKTKLQYTTLPANATDKTLVWSSGNSEIATVSSKGVVTGLKTGKVKITVSTPNGKFKTSCTVNVVMPVKSVKMNKSSMTLGIGKTAALTAVISPKTATNKEVTWKSSDYDVADVSATGKVTAKSLGSAVITATTKDGSFKCTCRVYVVRSVKSIKLDATNKTVEPGESFKLNYTIKPANPTNPNVKWSTSNKKVATVTKNGVVKAVGKGTAKITITTVDGGFTAVCTVNVVKMVTGIKVSRKAVTLTPGSSYTLKATVLPKNASNKNVIWRSGNSKVATVDKNGVITAKKAGKATITAVTEEGSFKAKCSVSVVIKAESVTLKKESLTVNSGSKVRIGYTVLPANTTDKSLTWKSGNKKIATVNQNGVVTGVSGGKVKITAETENGKTASCVVTVIPVPTSIKLSSTGISIYEGATKKLKATVLPTNAENRSVKWSSNNKKVATVDKNGKIKAIAAGMAVITVKTVEGGITAKCTVNVLKHVGSVEFEASEVKLNLGQSATLKAVVLPANASNKAVKWSTSNAAVVSVDSNGVIKAASGGSAVITVTTVDGAKSAKITVNVNVPVSGVTISQKEITLSDGTQKTLSATVLPQAAGNKRLTWSTSASDIVSVDANGVLTAKKAGKATITVKTVDGGYTDSALVTVYKGVKRADLSVTSAVLAPGESLKVTASIVPADAENKEIYWSSTNPRAATVDSNGTIKAVAVGKTDILVKNKDNTVVGKVSVEVLVPASAITLSGTKDTAWVGEKFTVKAQVSPSGATYKDVTFKSSDTKVASVDKNGVVTPTGVGECTVTVTSHCTRVSKTFKFTVKQKVTSIKLSKTALALEKGESETLSASVLPSNATNKAVTWESSNTAVATVSNGEVKAVSTGTATITVKSADGVSAKCTVTVSKHAESVTFEKSAYTLENGKTLTLKATVLPSDTSFKTLTYTSSDKAVVTVSAAGVVTAKGAGTATIVAKTADGVTGICRVTVTQGITKLTVSPASKTLSEGEKVTLSFTYEPKNATSKDVTWSSSNTKVATVDQNGVVTAVSVGEAKITVKSKTNSSVSSVCTVKVTRKVTGVSIKESALSLTVGAKSVKLTLEILPAGASNKNVTWRSSDTSVATVDGNGNVTAKGKGTAVISVKTADGSFMDTCNVTVK